MIGLSTVDDQMSIESIITIPSKNAKLTVVLFDSIKKYTRQEPVSSIRS